MLPEAVVFDIDSTLADTFHRQGMILQGDQREDTDWLAYAKACTNDTPTAAVALVNLLAQTPYKIILLTSRPEGARKETNDWLNRHLVYDRLIMDDNSNLGTVGYKVTALKLLQREYDIKLLVEDSWNIRTAVEAELEIPTLVVRAYAPESLELRY